MAKKLHGYSFRLTHLLLDFWERLDKDAWVNNDTNILVRCVMARQDKGIPSVFG